MKKRTSVLLGVTGLLLVAFLLGPRPVANVPPPPSALPDDLDAYLATSEARFDDLRPGVEKSIIWADSSKTRTPLAVVYLHGFSATREEVRPLPDTVAARLGANLFYTRLAGHGRSGDALAETTAADWLADGYEALAIGQRLGERVVLIGTSTGGTLATWLAAQPEAKNLLALVLISPNYGPKDPKASLLLWPWGVQLAKLMAGSHRAWTPHNAEQAHYWTTRYRIDALVSMMSLVDLVDQIDLSAIETPLLIVYSPNDQVVNPAYIEAQFPVFGTSVKHRIAIDSAGDPSNHVLAGAILSPATTQPLADSILAFLHPMWPVSPPDAH